MPGAQFWSLHDPYAGHYSTAPEIVLDEGATITAEQLSTLGWKWLPATPWSPLLQCFQGQVVGSPPAAADDDDSLRPRAHAHSQCHVRNPYCVHNTLADITPANISQSLRSLLGTAQNLAECHNRLAYWRQVRDSATGVAGVPLSTLPVRRCLLRCQQHPWCALECLRAIGHRDACHCLKEHTPAPITDGAIV